MALLFMDGFDAGDVATKWTSSVIPTVSATTRFSVGRSLGLGSGGTRSATKYFAASNEIYVGFAATGIVTGFNTITFFNTFTDAGLSAQLNLVTNTNGSISIRRGATQIAVTAAGLFSSGWKYIEFYAKIDPTVGVATLRSDGIVVATFSGNTKNGGTANAIDGIQLSNSGTILSGLYDDLYILDSTGSAPYNTFLGDVRIHTTIPNAAGNSTQLTPSAGANYTTVDELPYSATDYVTGASSGLKDTYAMSELPAGVSTIYALQTNLIAKKSDAGTTAIRPVLRSAGTDYAGTNQYLSSYDVTYSAINTVDPATSSAWTVSNVNSLETGVEVI